MYTLSISNLIGIFSAFYGSIPFSTKVENISCLGEENILPNYSAIFT